MKQKIADFFKKFNLFDYIFFPTSLIAVVVVSIIFQCDALSIVYSIIGITSVFLMSKGFFVAYFVAVVAYILYSVQSYLNGLYGEAILHVFIALPLQVYAIIRGFMGKNNKDGDKIIMRKLKLPEWLILSVAVIALTTGGYFMLGAFGTRFLILSTLSLGLNILAYYLQARGSFVSYFGFITSNLITLTLWLLPLVNGEPSGTNFVPMLVSFVFYFVTNIYGLINWTKLRKKQTANVQTKEV